MCDACNKTNTINFQIELPCRQGDCEWTSTAAGFTKLERACIDLKVPHPDLPPELRELILESRRLDWKARHFPKK